MKKYKVIDLFCGCGGISSGFDQAGFSVVGGIDFNEDAINTYNLNFKNAEGYSMDLTKLEDHKINKIFKNFKDNEKIDVIIGGPPCQGFSSANRYKKEEGDDRNKLFFEFVKFVETNKPKIFLMENVRGILTQNEGYTRKMIYSIFEELGYHVNHDVLNAADYGVPQNRLRAFFIGTLRSELKKFDFNILKKAKQQTTVWDAIGEMYHLENSNDKEGIFELVNDSVISVYGDYLREGSNIITNHEIKYPAQKVQDRILWVPQGGNWRDVPEFLFDNNRKNRHSSAFKRLAEDKPSVTIDTGNAHSNYYHPKYNRIPTVRESARIQSFKDNFIFTGSRTSQYRQVGNAVPPLLARALAEGIKEELCKIKK